MRRKFHMELGRVTAAGAGIVAALGAGTAALLMHWVPIFEGTIPRGYVDPVGIITACTGHTETAELRPYTEEECRTLLDGDLLKHAEGAMRCVDFEPMTPARRAAVVSFSFNVGVAQIGRAHV